MKKLLLSLAALTLVCTLFSAEAVMSPNPTTLFSDTTFRIVPSTNGTYGYEILIRDKVFIRQLNIPGHQGLLGFKKKGDSEKVAQLVLKKLSQGILPPTVERKELQALNIHH